MDSILSLTFDRSTLQKSTRIYVFVISWIFRFFAFLKLWCCTHQIILLCTRWPLHLYHTSSTPPLRVDFPRFSLQNRSYVAQLVERKAIASSRAARPLNINPSTPQTTCADQVNAVLGRWFKWLLFGSRHVQNCFFQSSFWLDSLPCSTHATHIPMISPQPPF